MNDIDTTIEEAMLRIRKSRLRELVSKPYEIEILEENEAMRSASTEDLFWYLDCTDPSDEDGYYLYRWVAVTQGGENSSYFVKSFPTRERAEEYAGENMQDDIFNEVPCAVVDLESDEAPWGKIYEAKITVEFEQ